MSIIGYLNATLAEFKSKVSKLFELGESPFFLRIMQENASVLLNVNKESDGKTLKTLKFHNYCDIFINKESALEVILFILY